MPDKKPQGLSQFEIKETQNNSENMRFLIMCLTCSLYLMQFPQDPDLNVGSKRVMRSAVNDHQDLFARPHQIEKIDLQKNTSVSVPPQTIKLFYKNYLT